jgi:protein-tyrosine phosphatase
MTSGDAPSMIESWIGFMRTIAECDHAVVFHCAVGKDRTGIVAAMLLASLGVPDETIVNDYGLSDRALEV